MDCVHRNKAKVLLYIPFSNSLVSLSTSLRSSVVGFYISCGFSYDMFLLYIFPVCNSLEMLPAAQRVFFFFLSLSFVFAVAAVAVGRSVVDLVVRLLYCFLVSLSLGCWAAVARNRERCRLLLRVVDVTQQMNKDTHDDKRDTNETERESSFISLSSK